MLKNILIVNQISQSDVARQLGMSQQSFNQMLAAQDVKSTLLERIAEVLGVGMSFFYPMAGTNNSVASGDGSISVASNGNVHIKESSILQERIKALEQQVKDKESLLAEKERTIKILMER